MSFPSPPFTSFHHPKSSIPPSSSSSSLSAIVCYDHLPLPATTTLCHHHYHIHNDDHPLLRERETPHPAQKFSGPGLQEPLLPSLLIFTVEIGYTFLRFLMSCSGLTVDREGHVSPFCSFYPPPCRITGPCVWILQLALTTESYSPLIQPVIQQDHTTGVYN